MLFASPTDKFLTIKTAKEQYDAIDEEYQRLKELVDEKVKARDELEESLEQERDFVGEMMEALMQMDEESKSSILTEQER